MVRRGRRKTLDRHQAAKYMQVARALRKSLADLDTIAEDGDRYGNAMGIVSVHSAIAYSDALSIAYGGFKSADGDHERAVEALKAALGLRMDPDQGQQLLAIVKTKDAVSYQEVYYTVADARALLQRLEGFAAWAEDMSTAGHDMSLILDRDDQGRPVLRQRRSVPHAGRRHRRAPHALRPRPRDP